MPRRRSLVTAACLCAIPLSAHAHFKLNSPASMSVQDQPYGSPQKSAPCGLSDISETRDDSIPTNAVTILKAGALIDVSITETIFHPGHYRVALAQDIASLPANPPVTADTTDCGSTIIDPNPTLPVLADGLLQHTSGLSGTQTLKVQLPPGMTCTNCVLQVTQFMSNHGLNVPGGCYYHHCATVSVTLEGPPPDDDDPSGGCSSQRSATSALGLALAAVIGGLVFRRRRR